MGGVLWHFGGHLINRILMKWKCILPSLKTSKLLKAPIQHKESFPQGWMSLLVWVAWVGSS